MSNTLEVKICGLTRRRDVELAVELGANYVGFVLFPRSPRYVAGERLSELTRDLPRQVKRVGVFVNESREEIRRVAEGNLDIIQLHGSESPELALGWDYLVWKAVSIVREEDLAKLEDYRVERFLLDATKGGSGTVCDWRLASLAAKRWPVMLAGGLGITNIRTAIARVRPMGVDLSSSLEDAPGIKSETKMREFFKELDR